MFLLRYKTKLYFINSHYSTAYVFPHPFHHLHSTLEHFHGSVADAMRKITHPIKIDATIIGPISWHYRSTQNCHTAQLSLRGSWLLHHEKSTRQIHMNEQKSLKLFNSHNDRTTSALLAQSTAHTASSASTQWAHTLLSFATHSTQLFKTLAPLLTEAQLSITTSHASSPFNFFTIHFLCSY